MNFLKPLLAKVSASSLLLAQLSFALTGLFTHAASAATDEADAVSTTQSANSSVKTSSPELAPDPEKSLHPLLVPIASLTQNLAKLPLLQSYRVESTLYDSENTSSTLPITATIAANYVPSQVPLKLATTQMPEDAIAPDDPLLASGWQAQSSQSLKQWRQPSIQVLTVDASKVGRSLHASASSADMTVTSSDASSARENSLQPTPGASSAEDWTSFCFASLSPRSLSPKSLSPKSLSPKSLSPKLKKAYHLVINQRVVAEFTDIAQANLVAKRLRRWIQDKMFMPTSLVAKVRDNKVLGLSKDNVFFEVDKAISQLLGQNQHTIAIAWINNLRNALNVKPLTLVEAQIQLYNLEPTGEVMSGTASWYGPYFHGRQTASGEYFHEGELTVAHKSLPFDTFLQVTNQKNDRSVIVRVNDRGPYIGERSLDLSRNAAQCLGSEEVGVINYEALLMLPAQ